MSEVEKVFWTIFNRVMSVNLAPAQYSVDQLEAWDSLRHIELIFELEEQFRKTIEPDQIADLYSDTQTIIAFLEPAPQATAPE